jgi:hypothetical protein
MIIAIVTIFFTFPHVHTILRPIYPPTPGSLPPVSGPEGSSNSTYK